MSRETPAGIWTRLAADRSHKESTWERLAALTIPKVYPQEGQNRLNVIDSTDYQSIGASGVNHLSNKLMMAMFRPSMPFFKIQPTKESMEALIAGGQSEASVAGSLAAAERQAMKEWDATGQRPKLYQLMRHLIVVGNVLLIRKKKTKKIRVMGLKNFVVKRTIEGKLHTLVIREKTKHDELEPKVQQVLRAARRYNSESEAHYYIEVTLVDGRYHVRQAVDDIILPDEFNGNYSEDDLPYRVLTWDLSDNDDYATGLIEEYIGALEALSALAEGVVNGGVLAAKWRWLVNPSGQTTIEDLNASKNGDALPGTPEDVQPTQGGDPKAVEILLALMKHYEQQLGRVFLMSSAVTRDAERVTTEEIRMQINELEMAHSGVFSTMTIQIQRPLAMWITEDADIEVDGKEADIVILTGLDALSRNADLENLRLALGDLALFDDLPDELKGRLIYDTLVSFVGAGRGVDLSSFVMSDAAFAEKQQQQQAAMQQAMAAQEGAAAGAAAAVNPQGEPQQ